MRRMIDEALAAWRDSPDRKPVIVRGARQVGKSYLVRLFAKEYALDLLEINFELNDDVSGGVKMYPKRRFKNV